MLHSQSTLSLIQALSLSTGMESPVVPGMSPQLGVHREHCSDGPQAAQRYAWAGARPATKLSPNPM